MMIFLFPEFRLYWPIPENKCGKFQSPSNSPAAARNENIFARLEWNISAASGRELFEKV